MEGCENSRDLSGQSQKTQMRMIDMHAHLSCLEENPERRDKDTLIKDGGQEIQEREAEGILTCFCAGTPGQWEILRHFQGRRGVLAGFGIHPWYADQYQTEMAVTGLKECDMIGEIGMDSVWCQVPLSVQQKVLERQLQAAEELEKPVVLHTKGQERRIGEMIRGFRGKVCVHWYSGKEEDLDPFLEQDCYFTLGPDTAALCRGEFGAKHREEARVRARMIKELSPSRLFVETDGVSAVKWAFEEGETDFSGFLRGKREELAFRVLRENMEYAAAQKELSFSEMEERMRRNLKEFLKPGK